MCQLTPFRLITVTLSALLLLMAGCTRYELEGKRYEIEREYFLAEKLVEHYGVKPELRTTEDYFQLVRSYLEVHNRFLELFPSLPRRDSLQLPEMEASFLGGRSLLKASSLLMTAEQFDSAEVLLRQILDAPYYSLNHRFDALLALGKVAENQAQWVDAEGYYLSLLEEYYPPLEAEGRPANDVLTLPRAIVEHYAGIGDQQAASAKAEWAIDYYKGIVDSFPPMPLTLAATRLLAEMYTVTGEHKAAVTLLQTVVDSTGKILDPVKAMIADIYLTRLDRSKDAVALYEELIAEGTDSISVALSYMKLAAVAIDARDYQRGRDYLDALKVRFPRASTVLAQSQRLKGRSFELEQNYERARQEYLALINEFPATPQGLETLVELPDFFRRIGQPEMASDWTQRCEERLRGLARDYANRQIGLQASSYLGTFLLRNGRIDEAITQYEELRRQYPRSAQATDALIRIAMIYRNDKKDLPKALETLREFVKQYPRSVVTPRVEEEIAKIEKELS